ARRLIPDGELIEYKKPRGKASSQTAGIAIRGTEGLVVSYARCCWPLPGDQIMGHLSAGRGIVIHRNKCQNMVAELRNSPDKCIPLRWADQVNREFQTELRISLVNQRGMLAIIARIVTDSDANIDFVNAEEKGAHHGTIHLGLSVRDRIHLAQIIKRLRVLNGIDRVVRHRA
ncbi:MAG: guanosine-3',5'-bis(diphosphate) 3'-diphosphatase, partial [Moraxellaceae bacterium]|nr:guanosine-3',5'-bis(diphosphate) 3'-diphosphatase [Moraxellaceae bacterium]